MLKSMTAYAGGEQTDQELTVCTEIRTYNSRHLDVSLRLPARYLNFEEKIKKRVTAAFVRGRIEVRIKIQSNAEAAHTYEADLPKAKAYMLAVHQLKDHLKLAGEVSVEQLLAVPGMVVPCETRDVERHWPLLAACLKQTLEDVNAMRQKEGDYLGRDLEQRLDFIEQGLGQIEAVAPGLVTQYRDKLKSRIEALTNGVVELDAARMAQEASILADRSDISEEIVRSRSHVAQFRSILKDDAPAGRKLNFLLQEFNREFNTMGAKVGQAEVAHTIVDIKAEIEKLREQVQNIE
jgi:uncharacterized protein (TIGR00255 family)